MTSTLTRANVWFSQKSFLFPFLALTIPLLVRAIPEVLMGQYPVGFDPMGYYVPDTLLWLRNGISPLELVSYAPLLYLLTMGVTAAGGSLILFLKVLAPLLLGLLGFAVYHYANRALTWSPGKSLTVAVLSTLYFVALRISWDMLRSELALIFLFAALIILQSPNHNRKRWVLLAATMTLVVFSQQLIAVVMFAVIIATLLQLALKKQKTEAIRLFAASIPAVLLLTVIVILSSAISSPLLGYSNNFSGGIDILTNISQLQLVFNTFGFLLFCYLPLVPLLVFSRKRFKGDFHLFAWMVWLLIPLVIAVITPYNLFLGGVLPYRWVLLFTYPLSFFAIEALFNIKSKWYRVAIAVSLAILSVSFIALPNNQSFGYFATYPKYSPKTMLESTMPQSDCQDAVTALHWAQTNLPSNASLMVHEAFYGWALLNFDNNRLAPYFFENLTYATTKMQETHPFSPVYLIWWVNGTGWYGQTNVPSIYSETYHSGNVAIYQLKG